MPFFLANRIKGEEFSSSAAAIAEYASKELVERAHLIMPEVEESVWLVTKQILASGTSMAIAASSSSIDISLPAILNVLWPVIIATLPLKRFFWDRTGLEIGKQD